MKEGSRRTGETYQPTKEGRIEVFLGDLREVGGDGRNSQTDNRERDLPTYEVYGGRRTRNVV